jgi:hypothetical protein
VVEPLGQGLPVVIPSRDDRVGLDGGHILIIHLRQLNYATAG